MIAVPEKVWEGYIPECGRYPTVHPPLRARQEGQSVPVQESCRDLTALRNNEQSAQELSDTLLRLAEQVNPKTPRKHCCHRACAQGRGSPLSPGRSGNPVHLQTRHEGPRTVLAGSPLGGGVCSASRVTCRKPRGGRSTLMFSLIGKMCENIKSPRDKRLCIAYSHHASLL
jgi:hypothetical protein